jgi:hypothetical protein
VLCLGGEGLHAGAQALALLLKCMPGEVVLPHDNGGQTAGVMTVEMQTFAAAADRF